MARELAWLQRDLKDLQKLGTLLLPLGSMDGLKAAAWQLLRRYLFRSESQLPRQAHFEKVLYRADQERRGIITKFRISCGGCSSMPANRTAAGEEANQSGDLLLGMRAQMETLAPRDLLERYEFSDLPHLTRFLKAFCCAERAKSHIQSDIEKVNVSCPLKRPSRPSASAVQQLTSLPHITGGI